MSLITTIDGIAYDRDGVRSVASTKIDLIRHGVVCSRGWGIVDDARSRWTSWSGEPDGLAEYSAAELLETRRFALLLNTYLSETEAGEEARPSDAFRTLDRELRSDASSRLYAAVAGQLAAALLGVSALQNTSWISADPDETPLGAAHTPRFVGTRDDEPDRWIAVTSNADAAPATGPMCTSLRVMFDLNDDGDLDAQLRPAASGDVLLPQLDRDRLEELRYGPLARAIASGAKRRVVEVQRGRATVAEVLLIPLGFAGYLGVSVPFADAIDDALGGAADASLATFAGRIRALRHERSPRNPIAGSPLRVTKSHVTSATHRVAPVSIDGMEFDVSLGRDGIALLLPSSVVRTRPTEARAA